MKPLATVDSLNDSASVLGLVHKIGKAAVWSKLSQANPAEPTVQKAFLHAIYRSSHVVIY